MQFIEIENGLTINTEEIVAFEDNKLGGTRIYLDFMGNSLEIGTNYELFKGMIKANVMKATSFSKDLRTIASSAYTPVP